jgi:hypothetical protein
VPGGVGARLPLARATAYLSPFVATSSRIGASGGTGVLLTFDPRAKMTDSSPHSRGPHEGLPPATVYDPARDGQTPFGAEPTGTVVLLLVGEVEARWAAETAVELSTTWAGNGRRIVLADLFLENPILHQAAGAENLEGVVDVFLYGASISRSARPVKGRGFYLIPAGTYAPDGEAIYRHPRWPKLVAGFRDAHASLVLFVPAGGADLAGIAEWVSQVVLLGTPRDLAVLDAVAHAELRGRIEPPPAGGVADAGGTSVLDLLPPPPPPAAALLEEELHLPPPPPRPRPRSSRLINVALWALLAAAIAGAATYLVAMLRPELLPDWTGAREARNDTVVAPIRRTVRTAAAPRAVGAPLPYTVQVINYRSFPAARRQLDRLRTGSASALFFVSPQEIDRILYYQILAGALPDSTAARAVKDALVASGAIRAEDAADAGSLVQPTPLAFELGEFASEDSARVRADSLLAREIPAYPVAVPYSDNSRRWRLYGGAFPDSASAEGMRRLLVRAGLPIRLVERSGVATLGGR